MKLNRLVLVGVASFLTSILPATSFAGEVPAISTNNIVLAQNQNGLMSGTFVAAEHPTTGMARIVMENGHRYLELNSAFSTNEMGPDLHVLLEPSEKPPQKYQDRDLGRFVNLGRLQKFKGTQRYPIPDKIDLSSYKFVSIWCRMANATFGYAPLRTSSTTSKSSSL